MQKVYCKCDGQVASVYACSDSIGYKTFYDPERGYSQIGVPLDGDWKCYMELENYECVKCGQRFGRLEEALEEGKISLREEDHQ
jgi:hypothetical protein